MTKISRDLRQWCIRPFCLKAYPPFDCEIHFLRLMSLNLNNSAKPRNLSKICEFYLFLLVFFSSQQHCLDVWQSRVSGFWTVRADDRGNIHSQGPTRNRGERRETIWKGAEKSGLYLSSCLAWSVCFRGRTLYDSQPRLPQGLKNGTFRSCVCLLNLFLFKELIVC